MLSHPENDEKAIAERTANGFAYGELKVLRDHMSRWNLTLTEVLERSTPTLDEQIADLEETRAIIDAKIVLMKESR